MFAVCLLCNSGVQPSWPEGTTKVDVGLPEFQSESPDEVAFMQAMSDYGFVY